MKAKRLIIRIFVSDLFVSIFIPFVCGLFVLLIFGFRTIYSTNDDYFMSLFISQGEDKSIFLNWFLTFSLCCFQKVLPEINVFIVSQIILSFISVVAINFVLLCVFKRRLGIFFALIFDVLYIAVAVVYIQWTHTTVLLCSAGLLLLINSVRNSCNLYKKLKIGIGISLSVVSSLYRYTSFAVVFFIFLFYVLVCIIVDFLINKGKQIKFFENLKTVFIKSNKVVLAFLLVLICSTTLNLVSELIKTTDQDYLSFANYNSVRSASVDYPRAPYEGNEEFYNSIEIFSQNDLNMLGTWHGEEKFFTYTRLKEISEYSSNPKFQTRFSLNYIFQLIINKIQSITFFSPYIILACIIVLSLLIISVLFIFRNKVKYVFPVILVFFWLAFFYVFGFAEYNYFILPIAVISVISSFLCNRYNYLVNVAITLLFFVFYLYLVFSRISFRATINIVVPVYILSIYSFRKKSIRFSVNIWKFQTKRVISFICIFFVISGTILSAYFVFNNEISRRIVPINSKLSKNIQTHDENVYVCELQSLREICINYNSPLRAPIAVDNVIQEMGWVVGSTYYHKELTNNNISDLFLNMINENRIKLVLKDSEIKDMYELYFNQHYSNEGNIVLKEEYVADGFSVYLVSCDKNQL